MIRLRQDKRRSTWSYGLAILLLLASGPSIAQPKKWTLKECINEAWAKNITLNQTEISDEVNKINYTQSKNNPYPNLNLTDGHSLYYGHSVNPATGRYVKQNASENSPALTSTVTLYNGSRNFNLIKQNRLICDASSLDIEKTKNDIALNITAAYLQVLYEYQAAEIAQLQVNVTDEQVAFTKKYVAIGNKLLSSLYQAEAQLATNKAAKTNADNQLQLARVVLMQLMQMPITDDFDIERPDTSDITPVPVLSSSADIYYTAARTLPDVKSARIKIDASIVGLKVAKSELLPKLTLSGNLFSSYSNQNVQTHTTEGTQSIGYLKDNPGELVMGQVPVTTTSGYPFFNQLKDNFSQSLIFTLSVPIFNNLQSRNDVSKAKLAIKSSRLNESLAENTLRQAVEQAYTDQLAASKNYLATKEQLLYQQKYFEDIEKQLRQGMANMTDYLVGQNNYFGAKIANLQAKYEYLFKTKVLAFYTGEPLTK